MVRAAEQAAAAAGTSQRRSQNLERNRVAASKCRRRKSQWQAGLEDKKNELESRYKALRSETEELAEDVAQLRHMVMAHAFCNDANIDAWLRNQANNLTWSVGSSATPPGQASQASFSQASPSQASPSQTSASQASLSPDATSTEEDMLNFGTLLIPTTTKTPGLTMLTIFLQQTPALPYSTLILNPSSTRP